MKEKLNFNMYLGSLRDMAFDPVRSLGRRHENDDDIALYGNIFDPFRLDMEKIRASKAFRRLANKTQVFPPGKHPNIRNRLVHTNDVVSIAIMISDILGLNSNLAGAIALGHDIGHTAYGHLGERMITKISGKKFSHAVMGVVAAQLIERSGLGLNLTYEVLEGILHHTRGGGEMNIANHLPQENSLVMLADKIAYISADLNDAIRIGYLNRSYIPKKFSRFIGDSQRELVARISFALVQESAEKGFISFGDSEEAKIFSELRKWMYDNIYYKLDSEDYRSKLEFSFREMGEFFHNSPDIFPIGRYLPLALMTDVEAEAFNLFNRRNNFFVPTVHRKKFGFAEIIDRLPKNQRIDVFNPDLKKEDFKFHRQIL